MQLKQIVEALIFAAPDPISAAEIAKAIRRGMEEEELSSTIEDQEELASVTEEEVNAVIDSLSSQFTEEDRPIQFDQTSSGWRMVTRPQYADWIRCLLPEMRPEKLSPPALETLALVAYRQPITKADMEAVRGVSCDGMVNKLMERNLIESAGRADLPGRPMLYKTTALFLEHFGVNDIDALPNASELKTIELPTAQIEEEQTEETTAEDEEAQVEEEPSEIELAERALEAEERAAAETETAAEEE